MIRGARLIAAVALLAVAPLASIAWNAFRTHRTAKEFRKLNPNATIKCYYLSEFALNLLKLLFGVPSFPDDSHQYKIKYEMFKDSKDDVVAFVTPGKVHLYLANADLIREVALRARDFPKPIKYYKVLDIFGRNIVTMEGEEWRMHRKIVAPKFSERNNVAVHQETLRALNIMFDTWNHKASAQYDGGSLVNVREDPLQLALMIISGAAFGLRLEWDDQVDKPLTGNHKMSFQKALKQVNDNLLMYILFPKFLFAVPGLRHLGLVFREFTQYLDEIIDDAKSSGEDEHETLLQMLARTEASEDGVTMSRSELLGNAFVFFFAGHETTAGTISFALASMALNPSLQDKLYKEAKAVYGAEEGAPSYKQINDLHYATAIGYETLRLFPPVLDIPKWTEANETLGEYNLPPFTHIDFILSASQTNPNVFGDDALEFRPERFLGSDGKIASTNPRGLIAFSEGQRSCLGKRFAQIELTVALSMIASRYTIELPPDVRVDSIVAKKFITLKLMNPTRLVFKPR